MATSDRDDKAVVEEYVGVDQAASSSLNCHKCDQQGPPPLLAALALVMVTAVVLMLFYALPTSAVLFAASQPEEMIIPILLSAEIAAFFFSTAIWPLQVGYGYLLGLPTGLAIGMIGYVLGCIAPFLLAPIAMPLLAPVGARLHGGFRSLIASAGRRMPWLLSMLQRNSYLYLDGLWLALSEEPFQLVLCLRLNPVPPAGFTSWALGLSGVVPFWPFLLASGLGTAPNVLAYVYVGAILDSIFDLFAGRHVELTPQGSILIALSFIVSMVLMTRLARYGAARVEAVRLGEEEEATDSTAYIAAGACPRAGSHPQQGQRGPCSSQPDVHVLL